MRKLLIFVFCVTLLFIISCSSEQPDRSTFWQDGYCLQTNVRSVEANLESIAVNTLEDGWKVFKIVDFPESFVEWSGRRRLEFLQNFKGGRPELAGPHNGIVATYGYQRSDAQFSLNNAVKGMGFVPKPEKMAEMTALLDSTQDASYQEKMAILEGFYQNLEENFDLDKQASLELYSRPEYMTQTFLNQMYNPVSTIVFLDIPSYKLKTIARLIDPKNPELTEYERQVVTWINKIHSYFHGPFSVDFIGVIYYVVEVYDNSPRGKDPQTGMGRRLMPLLP
ncbi:MAG: hypothetical protein K9M99_10190 [Candidatus Cloacimonetes bacterium]|nr:hypothetical protein [Candidatus Cloacimonadota bacterium]